MRPRFPILLPICLCLAGCSDDQPRVWHVDGLLTVNGVPAGNASIALHRRGEPSAACPVGISRPDGTFELTTFAPNDGAPPGQYDVTLIWHDASRPVDECECVDPLQHDLLRGFYADPRRSDLHITIDREHARLRLAAEAPADVLDRGGATSDRGMLFDR